MKLLPVRAATENWSNARKLIASSPGWATWLNQKRAAVDHWYEPLNALLPVNVPVVTLPVKPGKLVLSMENPISSLLLRFGFVEKAWLLLL